MTLSFKATAGDCFSLMMSSMNKHQIPSPLFKYNKLEISPAGTFRGVRLYRDDEVVKLKRGKAMILDDNGYERAVAICTNPFDHLWVEIEGEKFYPMGKLSTLERVFVFMPLVLMVIGGAIGGGVGAFASFTNSNLIREFKDSAPLKYGLCLVTTTLATVIWILGATMVQMIASK